MGDSDIFDGCARLGPGGSIETLVVQGPDAEDFLQRLISCDLNAVQPGVGSRGTLLGGKGRIVAYFDVHRLQDGLLLITEAELIEILHSHLERLIILEDVELRRGLYEVVSLQGPDATSQTLELTGFSPESFLSSECWETGLVVNRPRCPSHGFDLVVAAEALPALEENLQNSGVLEASRESCEHARIVAGMPRIGHEVNARSLPPEVALEDAISYDKGCYAGQEVLARIRTYGHVNRQLRRIEISVSDCPVLPSVEVGDDLFAEGEEGKAAAKVTSVAHGDGVIHLLASVRRSHAEKGTRLIWRDQDNQESVQCSGEVELPFKP